MAGETNIGGIVGFLRLEADQFHREIERALAELELLDGKRVDIRVDIDRTGAASIAATEAQVEKLDSSVKKVDKSSRSARGGMGALATAVIALGPAMVPLAAGAVGLAAAFGGMGTAGVLAIVGIKREMEQGTATGLAFWSAIDSAKSDMQELAGVAARNVLRPFQDAVADLNDRMPALKGQIGDLATVTGKAAGALAGGLLSAFQALEPLMRDVSVYVLDLSRRFQEAMSGPGVVAFGDYVRSVFPQVMSAIESIVEAAGRLIAALAPLGGGVLSMVKLLADVINGFDPTALTALATAAGAVFVGFRSWQGLSTLVGKLATALGGVEAMGTRAAGAIRGLQVASGVIGVALAGLSFVMSAMSSNTAEAQAATDNLTDALIRSNGAIDENVRLAALKNAQDSGAIDDARMLGITTQQVVDAYLGQAGALGDLSAQRDAAMHKQRELIDAGKDEGVTVTDVQNAYLNLQNKLAAAGIQWDDTKVKVQQHNDALKVSASASDAAASAAQNLANTYGVSAATYSAVAASQQGIADKAAQATLEMQLENNAAGLLKASLDKLNGTNLDAASTQNAFESSLANMGDHVDKTGKKITFTTTSIKDMSAASVALRGQLLGQVQNAENAAEAFGQMKGSTEAGRQKLIEMRKQIIENAVAHHVDRKAVESYIDQVLKIPESVPPTKLDVDKKAAETKLADFQAHVNALKGKTVTITTLVRTIQDFVTSGDSSYQAAKNRAALSDLRATGGLTLPNGTRKMASGDVLGAGESMIMRSTKPILWNEAPGGEAYISLAPEKRARSRQIWEETGRLLGAGGSSSRMHPDDVKAIVNGMATAVRGLPRQRVDVDDFNRRLA